MLSRKPTINGGAAASSEHSVAKTFKFGDDQTSPNGVADVVQDTGAKQLDHDLQFIDVEDPFGEMMNFLTKHLEATAGKFVKKLYEKIAELQMKVENKEERCEELKATVDEQKARINDKEQRVKQLKADVEEWTGRLGDSRKLVAKFSAEKEDLVRKNRELQADVDNLKTCLKEAEDEADNASKISVDLKNKNHELQADVEKVFKISTELKKKNYELQATVDDLEARVDGKEQRKVYQTPAGPVTEDEHGNLTLPDGSRSEVVSHYSDSTMPGGVVDDDGCIRKDAPNLVKVGADEKEANDPGIKAYITMSDAEKEADETTEPNDVTMIPAPSSPLGHSENPICVEQDTDVDVHIDTREVEGTIKYETACILFKIFKSDHDKHKKWNMECIDVGGERRKEFTQLDLYVLVEAHTAGFICRVKEDPKSTITDTKCISLTPIFLTYVDAWIFKGLPKSTDADAMENMGLPPMWFNKEPDDFDICLNQNCDERSLMTILVGEITEALTSTSACDGMDYDDIEQYAKERMQALYLRGDYLRHSNESDDDEDQDRNNAANDLFEYFDKTPWLRTKHVFTDKIERTACDLVLDFGDNEMFRSFWDDGDKQVTVEALVQAMKVHAKKKQTDRELLLKKTTLAILESDRTRIQSSTQAEEYWDRLPKEDQDEFRTESLTLTTKDKIFINKVAHDFNKLPPESPVKDPSIAFLTRSANGKGRSHKKNTVTDSDDSIVPGVAGKRKRVQTNRYEPPDTPSAMQSAAPKSPVKQKPLTSLSEKIGDIDSDKWKIFYANQNVLCNSIGDERKFLRSQFQRVSGKQPTGRQIAKLAVGESMKILPYSQYVKLLTARGQKEDKSFNLLFAIINGVRRRFEQKLEKGKGYKECKQKLHAETVSLENCLKKLQDEDSSSDSSGDSSSESSDADDSALDEDGSEKNACVKVTADDSALHEDCSEEPEDIEKLRSVFDSSDEDDDSGDEEQALKKQKVVDYKSFWEQAACMDEVDTNIKNLSDEEKQKVFESMAKTYVTEKFKRATEYEINDKQREYFTKKILDDDMSTLKGRERVLKKLTGYLNK